MSDQASQTEDPDMLDEYDFTDGVRGKYFEQYRSGTNIVVLDPDVADVFPDSASVNEALRLLIKLAHKQVPSAAR
jgi:hypothetical protein